MRRAARVDSNHGEIVAALEKCGALVTSLAAVGGGVADLLVLFRGELRLIEVKDGKKSPSERKLTKAQVAWHRLWPVTLVSSVEEAIAALRA